MNKKQKEELAKYLLDISKFVFAGVVLIKLLEPNTFEKLIVLTSGLFSTLGLLYVGLKLLKS